MSENIQDALKPQPLKKPMDKSQCGGDVAAINSLLGLLNDPRITGAAVPKGEQVTANTTLDKTGATMLPTDPVITTKPVKPKPSPPIVQNSAPAPIARATPPNKIFFTGLIGAGKDFIAEQIGAKVIGLADPLYHLASYFFGVKVSSSEGKELPGMRIFLQLAGQWGRCHFDEKYQFTAARACFVSMIRSIGEARRFDEQYCIDWAAYGKDPDIWLNGVKQRVENYLLSNPSGRIAVTNCRFKNEFQKLQEFGFSHFHIMASPATRASRVKVDAAAANDTSEQLATWLNNDVTKKISTQPNGDKLKVIWSDTAPMPSPRLYSVAEFVQRFNVAVTHAPDDIIFTGE